MELYEIYQKILNLLYDIDNIAIDMNINTKYFTDNGDFVIRRIQNNLNYKNLNVFDVYSISVVPQGLKIQYYKSENNGTLILQDFTFTIVTNYNNTDFIELYRQFFMCYNRLLHINRTVNDHKTRK